MAAPLFQNPAPKPHPKIGASSPDRSFFDMQNPPPPPQSAPNQNGHGNLVQHRLSIDFQSGGYAGGNGNGNGGIPMSNGSQHPMPNGGSRHRNTVSMGAFDGPRSPPNTKNTSHVPCKFYRVGQCQAGKACPFSHEDNPTIDTPCKYFAKGNCKFGTKCALAHILPNGRRVNRPSVPMRGQLNIGGRVDPLLYQQSDPALRDSLLAQQANGVPIPFGHQIPPFVDNEYSIPPNMRENIPTIDTSYASRLDSIYGSPRDDSRHPLSPIGHLSTLDAPMPASFDSQGISYIARHGAVAASVPSKFGLESPPSSLPKKAAPPTDAVRNLHTSAWAREPRSRAPDLGSSPLGSGDEGFGQRIMHSKRTVKPGLLSASLPRQHSHIPDDDDYEPFAFSGEEDFIPGNLQDEVFTPEEKRRRRSRPDQDTKLMRESLSGVHSPTDSNSKVGSPMAGSPSRFGAFFREREAANNSMPSSFGHVGSPLRNSSLHPLTSPSLRATRVNGDTSPAFASPPGRTSGISQLLARARLSDSNDTPTLSSTSHSTSARNPSSSSNLTNRAVSSSSIGGTGRIDEEDGVFSMEEEEDDHRKRYSGNAWGYPSKPSPKLGAIGTRRGGAFS